jgi:hypothetical protein
MVNFVQNSKNPSSLIPHPSNNNNPKLGAEFKLAAEPKSKNLDIDSSKVIAEGRVSPNGFVVTTYRPRDPKNAEHVRAADAARQRDGEMLSNFVQGVGEFFLAPVKAALDHTVGGGLDVAKGNSKAAQQKERSRADFGNGVAIFFGKAVRSPLKIPYGIFVQPIKTGLETVVQKSAEGDHNGAARALGHVVARTPALIEGGIALPKIIKGGVKITKNVPNILRKVPTALLSLRTLKPIKLTQLFVGGNVLSGVEMKNALAGCHFYKLNLSKGEVIKIFNGLKKQKDAAPRQSSFFDGSVSQLSIPSQQKPITEYLFQLLPKRNVFEEIHTHAGPREVYVVNSGKLPSHFSVAGKLTSDISKKTPAVEIQLPPHSVTKVIIPEGSRHAFRAEDGSKVIYDSFHFTDHRDAIKLGVPVENMEMLSKLSHVISKQDKAKLVFKKGTLK